MTREIYTLNSFTNVAEGGNPAGVCLEGNSLTEEQMQSIAKEVGYSETAFVMDSKKADFRVRFFTPLSEVDLCGHATIALFSLMSQKSLLTPGTYTQETAAGLLNVEVLADHKIMMNQTLPFYGKEADKSVIANSLGLKVDELYENFPVQVVSTGLPDLIVPVKSLKTINNIKADLKSITEISREFGVSGYHVFTVETLNNSTAYCRNFAPLCGINEESATGTASGATAAYMFHHGLLNSDDVKDLRFEQGYSMNSPSEIHGSLEIENNKITRVRIGGQAVITGKKNTPLQ